MDARMAPLYRIVDWAEHFENNRTREMKVMRWVPLPNKLDGDGYTELLNHPDGAAHYGAWVAIVLIASKCKPRGTLVRVCRRKVRDACGNPAGACGGGCEAFCTPHDSGSLARISRVGAEVFDEAIPRLLQIGWLEVVRKIPQEGAGNPQEGAALGGTFLPGKEGKGREGNRKEEKGKEQETSRVGKQLDAPRPELTAATDQVVSHYKSYHSRAKPGTKERRKIQERLRDGHTADDLCEAIDGCHKTPHNLGANDQGAKYLGLELICRSSDQVTRFIENNRNPPEPKNERERRTLAARASWLDGGRHD